MESGTCTDRVAREPTPTDWAQKGLNVRAVVEPPPDPRKQLSWVWAPATNVDIPLVTLEQRFSATWPFWYRMELKGPLGPKQRSKIRIYGDGPQSPSRIYTHDSQPGSMPMSCTLALIKNLL